MSAPLGSWIKSLAAKLAPPAWDAMVADGNEIKTFRDEIVGELASHDPRMSALLNPMLDRIEQGRVKPPLLPQVSLEMLTMVRDPNVSFDKIAKLAVTDPTVAARIMKVASSAAHGGRIPPKGVKDGLVRLGLDGIRQVAFDLAFSSKTMRRGPHIKLVERVIRHARCTSALARLIARDVAVHPGTAALAGLIHGLGGIVVIDQLSNKRRIAKAVGSRDFVVPGFLVYLCVTRLHALVTAQVGVHFGLERSILDAAEHHHRSLDDADRMTKLLLLADVVSPGEPGARAMPLGQALERSGLELDEAKVRDRLYPLTMMFEELKSSFDVAA